MSVGVIDTPVDGSHEALRHAVVESTGGRGEDHGTWVASAIAARDTETERGRIRGMAPEVDLYCYGALGGGGATAGEIIEGVEWLLDRNVDFINMSLGGPHSDLLWESVRRAREDGALVISSVGNSGPAPGTASCPAHHQEAIAVGSTSFEGKPAAFSSRGPGFRDDPQKPEVMAYGGSAELVEDGLEITEVVLGAGANNSSVYLLGTSMASPQAVGMGALRVGADR